LTLCSVSPPTSRPTTFPYATLFRSESESQEALPESSGWYADSRLQGRGQFPGVLRQQHLLHSWQTGRRFEATGYGKQRMCLPERSEEHTSELQSRFELVCRLLLVKE